MGRNLELSFVAAVSLALLLPASTALAAGKAKGPRVPRFTEEAAAAGIEHRYDGEWEYFVGGGVAVLDCDSDGRPDLYLAGGIEPAELYRNQGAPRSALAFEKLDDRATDLDAVTGAYPLDIDSDGAMDLVVLRRGENVLLRGHGDCTFERANERWGFDGGDAWTTAFSATWEGSNQLPTLAFGNYVAPRAQNETVSCSPNILVRPDVTGGYAAAQELTPSWCTLSMLFSDWNRSGTPDLRVTNDRHYYTDGQDQLWRIAEGAPPEAYDAADGWEPLRIWGMGIASQDISGDGLPEVYLTSMGDNKLQTLSLGPDQPTYRDIALRRGVTAHRPFAGGEELPSTAWHAQFDDVNNDGRMDLFVSKGNVEAMPDHALKDPNDLFLGRPDGTFREAAKAAGILHYDRTRGAALVDLDVDGLLDIVEVNRREPVKLWRNLGGGKKGKAKPMGNWLAVELSQPGPNVDGVGAWIEVESGDATTTREVTVGGGHASGQATPAHFGLGSAKRARVRVIWPDGTVGPWQPVPANQRVLVDRADVSIEPAEAP